jgi:hypothetical protein
MLAPHSPHPLLEGSGQGILPETVVSAWKSAIAISHQLRILAAGKAKVCRRRVWHPIESQWPSGAFPATLEFLVTTRVALQAE